MLYSINMINVNAYIDLSYTVYVAMLNKKMDQQFTKAQKDKKKSCTS